MLEKLTGSYICLLTLQSVCLLPSHQCLSQTLLQCVQIPRLSWITCTLHCPSSVFLALDIELINYSVCAHKVFSTSIF